jgi:hypothetical protein
MSTFSGSDNIGNGDDIDDDDIDNEVLRWSGGEMKV